MNYRFAPSIHCCDTGGRLIFLDVTGDRYFGLDAAGEATVRALAARGCGESASLEALVRKGVLQAGPSGAAIDLAPKLTPPRRSLLEEAQPHPRLRACIRAGFAYRRARRRLRSGGFAAAIAELEKLKGGSRATDDAAPVAAAFDAVRLLFDSLDQCLPHSVALAGTLFRQRCDASFLIAVRSRPFRAHSWVQAGDRVLNDRLDNVRGFAPILVI